MAVSEYKFIQYILIRIQIHWISHNSSFQKSYKRQHTTVIESGTIDISTQKTDFVVFVVILNSISYYSLAIE